jgi:hypothetical protein
VVCRRAVIFVTSGVLLPAWSLKVGPFFRLFFFLRPCLCLCLSLGCMVRPLQLIPAKRTVRFGRVLSLVAFGRKDVCFSIYSEYPGVECSGGIYAP